MLFKVGDYVYVATNDKVRKCLVVAIETEAEYESDTIEKYTNVDLQDISNKGKFSYWTRELIRDLNTVIKLTPQELYNFDYE